MKRNLPPKIRFLSQVSSEDAHNLNKTVWMRVISPCPVELDSNSVRQLSCRIARAYQANNGDHANNISSEYVQPETSTNIKALFRYKWVSMT
mmetsp:Transcript_14252/g.18997  ORF Transcript_14252/g.18997 Transcript_14252/m.18997 type:complete len:92 (-) Transcript_14252:72-347(-)